MSIEIALRFATSLLTFQLPVVVMLMFSRIITIFKEFGVHFHYALDKPFPKERFPYYPLSVNFNIIPYGKTKRKFHF